MLVRHGEVQLRLRDYGLLRKALQVVAVIAHVHAAAGDLQALYFNDVGPYLPRQRLSPAADADEADILNAAVALGYLV